MKRAVTFGILATFVAATAIAAQRAQLGDNAPALTSDLIILQGGMPDVGGEGIQIVEFWATWCGPCKQTIPLLTEIHNELEPYGVEVIGISDEGIEKVGPYMQRMGRKKMAYTVAVDPTRRTHNDYLGAFRIQTIPHAFIVHDGKIVWHGNPGSPGMTSKLQVLIMAMEPEPSEADEADSES